eukprot:3114816-Rhodomonas_salina.6
MTGRAVDWSSTQRSTVNSLPFIEASYGMRADSSPHPGELCSRRRLTGVVAGMDVELLHDAVLSTNVVVSMYVVVTFPVAVVFSGTTGTAVVWLHVTEPGTPSW